MKFSQAWLRECVETQLSHEQLLSRLTMAGLEVDGVEPVAQLSGPFLVGKVNAVSPHPDADRLRLCTVDVGPDFKKGELLNIVCGAPNVAEGALVVVACEGAVTAQGLKIKPSKIRGQASEGMLVSEEELGLSESSDGLLILDEDILVGTDFLKWLKLDDVSIEVDLTPNRGDCLSVRGIAREVAALSQGQLNEELYPEWPVQTEHMLPVSIEDTQACPVYRGCLIQGVDPRAPTPLWMKERLRRSGLRPISVLVDVTNYVLVELGQPLHAFDASCLKGGITVRWAKSDEKLQLLDEKTVSLCQKDLVIADDSGPIALAGVMGGASTAVSDSTSAVFLECAFFSPLAVAGRARSHGLTTDAAHRFERGVDPALQEQALRRAVNLLVDIAGGQAGPEVVSQNSSTLPSREPVTLIADSIEKTLDLTLPDADVVAKLSALGCQVSPVTDGWQVIPPTHRFDIAIEEDLVEELARLVGYDVLPAKLPVIESRPILPSESLVTGPAIKQALVSLGFQEVITYSFVSEQLQSLLDPEAMPLKLKNPISSDMSVMRTRLWPGLARAALYNQNRRQQTIRLFEMGQVFHGQLPDTSSQDNAPSSLQQPEHIGGIWVGDAVSQLWLEPQRSVDFYDLKGAVETFLARCGHQSVAFEAKTCPVLHPGQSAQILIGSEPCGWAGRLHPTIEKALSFESAVYVFELVLSKVTTVSVPSYEPLSRYPAVRRDLALVVKESVTAQSVLSIIEDCCSGLLKETVLFDVFRAGSVPEGAKSLAVGLVLPSQSETLSEEVVNGYIARTVECLKSQLGAELRD